MSYDKKNWKANKVAERKGLEAKLDTFLKGALTSKVDIDKLTSHYKIAGLYAYSFRNQIMIMMQGGHGTIAMSKTKWGQFGREVTPEEKRRNNIIIFMPVFRDEIDPSTGKKESVLKFFRNVGLYRAEQTEGKALEYEHNSTGTVDYNNVKEVCEALTGAKVVEQITGTARGWSDGKDLTVSSMSNDVDKAKTLIHETAHHILHTGNEGSKKGLSKATLEVEAESVAHLVNSYMGLDYELTEAYVASYKAGIDDIRSSKVIKVADDIIKALK